VLPALLGTQPPHFAWLLPLTVIQSSTQTAPITEPMPASAIPATLGMDRLVFRLLLIVHSSPTQTESIMVQMPVSVFLASYGRQLTVSETALKLPTQLELLLKLSLVNASPVSPGAHRQHFASLQLLIVRRLQTLIVSITGRMLVIATTDTIGMAQLVY
jgi:hypothetical protein